VEIHFTTRDLAYISATVATVYGVGFITKMTLGAIPLPGIRTMTGAFFSTLVISIGLMRVQKVGALTLIQFIHGNISGFVFPAVPFLSLIVSGGIAGDLAVKLLKGTYQAKRYVVLACSICYFIEAVFLLYVMILVGYPGAVLQHEIIFSVAVVCLFLGMLGAYTGTKIADKLKKLGMV